ncbi:MAG: hypothetical protein CMJ22_05035 [Phycisphaerae bacterium]|nr:hypothetical protein [Phycisphaerae bacterium]HAC08718.1 hypothetical protein [Phycisphaerales bacterium]
MRWRRCFAITFAPGGVKVLHDRSSRDAGEVRHEGELVVGIRNGDHVGSCSYRGAAVQRP